MKRYPVRVSGAPYPSESRATFDAIVKMAGNSVVGDMNESVLARYYPGIVKAQAQLDEMRRQPPPLFEPDRRLPELSPDLADLFAPAQMHWQDLGVYRGRSLRLLNLMSDPATQTTKTFASLLMVARAIAHIRRTGENIIILVTTSGNKGIGLRSAVERAIMLNLVDAQQLRVVTLVPVTSVDKLRRSQLFDDPKLRRLNPILCYKGEDSVFLKQTGQNLQLRYFDECFQYTNTRIWYSLSIDNYQVADAARAFFEYECLLDRHELSSSIPRLHVHAVSSGFGFIGYHLGRTVLIEAKLATKQNNPGYFLIQHLRTPDMVLHAYTGSFDHNNLPNYTFNASMGLYVQEQHAHFPITTFELSESLDATFYSTTPTTAPQVSAMIKESGGGGIVISLHECLSVYGIVRSILARAGISITADPRHVAEWSTIMALTGVLKAIDRDLIPEQTEIVVHGTGYYARNADYTPICPEVLPSFDETTPLESLYAFIRNEQREP